MNFAAPWCLWALPALAVPVIIHLFNFRQTIKVYFSDNRFLEQVEKKTGYRRQIKQRLVLAARLFFLTFLILAFAQPYLQELAKKTRGKRVVVYLDNSMSMTGKLSSNERALDLGIRFAEHLVRSWPSDTEYRLITNDFSPTSRIFQPAEKVIEQLAQVEPTSLSRSSKEVQNQIQRDGSPGEVFWISDFQRSFFQLAPEDTLRFHPVVIPLPSIDNVYIDSVYLDNPFAVGGEPNMVRVRLGSMGKLATRNITVQLSIDGAPYGTVTVRPNVGYGEEISFALDAGLAGLHAARIELNDNLVQFDNVFYFTLNFSKKIQTLELVDKTANRHIADVFANPSLFQHQRKSTSEVSDVELEQADLVILHSLTSINESLQQRLAHRLEDPSKPLLLIPSEKPDLDAYQRLVGNGKIQINPTPELLAIEKPDLKNPFFHGVFETQSTPLYMPNGTALIHGHGDASTLLQLRNKEPFLTQRNKLFILACPLQNRYTNLDQSALFVPLMYKIAASGLPTERIRYYPVGQHSIAINLPKEKRTQPILLRGKYKEWMPAQRGVGDKQWVQLAGPAPQPGHYRAMQEDQVIDIVSLNTDRKESDLHSYSVGEMDSLYGKTVGIAAFDASDEQSLAQISQQRYTPPPLWKWALILAMLGLLAEIALIRLMK